MSTGVTAPVRLVQRGFGTTSRRDTWWIQPLVVFLGLTTFIVYSTWAAFQNAHYTFGPYLSPFYSPELFGSSPHSWFGPKPASWPAWLPFSPALLILPIPGLFRLTCYYYRGAYYKAFWADPPSCTVGEPRKSYWGENSFPLILQNVHRYVLFLALGVLALLDVDVWNALLVRRPGDRDGVVRHRRRVRWCLPRTSCCSAGTCSAATRCGTSWAVAATSCRIAPLGVQCYSCVSCLNRRHMVWAWCSLCSWASPTCTSGSAPWACGPTSGSGDARIPDTRTRRPRHRRRRSGACGPPSRPRLAASRSAWSANRCSARRTP